MVRFQPKRANLFSPYGWSYWLMMFCNVVSPQLFWSRKLRRNITVTFFMSIVVNIGMWYERFVIIVTCLPRRVPAVELEFYYSPTIWEIGFAPRYFLDCSLPASSSLQNTSRSLPWQRSNRSKTSGENYKRQR